MGADTRTTTADAPPPEADVIEGHAEELPPVDDPAPPPAVEAEPVASTPSAEVVPHTRPEGSTALIIAANAREKIEIATEIATQLDAVIRQQGLRTKIGRRKKVNPDGTDRWEDAYHVNVEAWLTLATFLDLAVVPLEPTQVIDPDTSKPKVTEYEVEKFYYPKGTKKAEIKSGQAEVERVERATIRGFDWQCRTEVYKDGTLLAAATAMVSRGEESWRDRDEHTLASMAQTRSIGKAVGTAARWIVTLAGYSATPAEEMPANGNGHDEEPPTAAAVPWAGRPSAELQKLGKRGLIYLLGGDKEAAGALWKSITAEPPTGATEAIGYCPRLVAQVIVRIGTAVQKREAARAKDLATEAADPPAPTEPETPAFGTVEDTPENRNRWCSCPAPAEGQDVPQPDDGCPIKNHGIPF